MCNIYLKLFYHANRVFHEFRKISDNIYFKILKISIALKDPNISDEYFLKHCWNSGKNDQKSKKSLSTRIPPKFFINPDQIANNPDQNIHLNKKKICISADRICNHQFKILGYSEFDVGQKINWHFDFKSKYAWNPKTYYKDINIPHGKADIKIPWELSRFNHALILGQAYLVSGDEKYAKEFVSQAEHWIDNNCFKFGVNWSNTMEVAIRSCNWLLGYYCLKNSPHLTEKFLIKFFKCLYSHGCHIRSNLHHNRIFTSNHDLAHLVGLLYISVLIPEFKHSRQWKKFAIKELKKDIGDLVSDDGCDGEASTCYHRFVLEMFFFGTLITIINDEEFDGHNHEHISLKIFGKSFTDKLYKMFKAILSLIKPDGRIPQIGDNDSGKLHFLNDQDSLDARHLLNWGAIFFKESNFKVKEFGLHEFTYWIFGPEGRKIWTELDTINIKDIKSTAFLNSGWFVMRNDRNYLIISAGPNGLNNYGLHCHNDKLSFELHSQGCNIIIDPGTYTYTSEPALRNQFRSTTNHNTVTIDNEEQNRFRRNKFSIYNDANVEVLKWSTSDDMDLFIGRNNGYTRLKNPVIHQRTIKFYKSSRDIKIDIIDELLGSGIHEVQWNFIFAPNKFDTLLFQPDSINWNKMTADYSPEYGKMVKTKKMSYLRKIKLPFKLSYSISLRHNG